MGNCISTTTSYRNDILIPLPSSFSSFIHNKGTDITKDDGDTVKNSTVAVDTIPQQNTQGPKDTNNPTHSSYTTGANNSSRLVKPSSFRSLSTYTTALTGGTTDRTKTPSTQLSTTGLTTVNNSNSNANVTVNHYDRIDIIVDVLNRSEEDELSIVPTSLSQLYTNRTFQSQQPSGTVDNTAIATTVTKSLLGSPKHSLSSLLLPPTHSMDYHEKFIRLLYGPGPEINPTNGRPIPSVSIEIYRDMYEPYIPDVARLYDLPLRTAEFRMPAINHQHFIPPIGGQMEKEEKDNSSKTVTSSSLPYYSCKLCSLRYFYNDTVILTACCAHQICIPCILEYVHVADPQGLQTIMRTYNNASTIIHTIPTLLPLSSSNRVTINDPSSSSGSSSMSASNNSMRRLHTIPILYHIISNLNEIHSVCPICQVPPFRITLLNPPESATVYPSNLSNVLIDQSTATVPTGPSDNPTLSIPTTNRTSANGSRTEEYLRSDKETDKNWNNPSIKLPMKVRYDESVVRHTVKNDKGTIVSSSEYADDNSTVFPNVTPRVQMVVVPSEEIRSITPLSILEKSNIENTISTRISAVESTTMQQPSVTAKDSMHPPLSSEALRSFLTKVQADDSVCTVSENSILSAHNTVFEVDINNITGTDVSFHNPTGQGNISPAEQEGTLVAELPSSVAETNPLLTVKFSTPETNTNTNNDRSQILNESITITTNINNHAPGNSANIPRTSLPTSLFNFSTNLSTTMSTGGLEQFADFSSTNMTEATIHHRSSSLHHGNDQSGTVITAIDPLHIPNSSSSLPGTSQPWYNSDTFLSHNLSHRTDTRVMYNPTITLGTEPGTIIVSSGHTGSYFSPTEQRMIYPGSSDDDERVETIVTSLIDDGLSSITSSQRLNNHEGGNSSSTMNPRFPLQPHRTVISVVSSNASDVTYANTTLNRSEEDSSSLPNVPTSSLSFPSSSPSSSSADQL